MKRQDYKSRKGKPITVCVSMTDLEHQIIKKKAQVNHGGNVSYYIRALALGYE